jgi:hypothetical protein
MESTEDARKGEQEAINQSMDIVERHVERIHMRRGKKRESNTGTIILIILFSVLITWLLEYLFDFPFALDRGTEQSALLLSMFW